MTIPRTLVSTEAPPAFGKGTPSEFGFTKAKYLPPATSYNRGSLRNKLFGIKPRTNCHGDCLQLLYPLLYGPHIDALLQENEEELDSHVWFDKPWRPWGE